jgi:hypothetical protein
VPLSGSDGEAHDGTVPNRGTCKYHGERGRPLLANRCGTCLSVVLALLDWASVRQQLGSRSGSASHVLSSPRGHASPATLMVALRVGSLTTDTGETTLLVLVGLRVIRLASHNKTLHPHVWSARL